MTDVDDTALKKLTDTDTVKDLECRSPDVDHLDAKIVEEDQSLTFVNTEGDASTPVGQREMSEKDLNSPDSNDSGIQADAQSFQHLDDDLDLYAVVKKPKRKDATDPTEDHSVTEESDERTEDPLRITSSKIDDVLVVKENQRDDPYSMVEFDSSDKDEENDESAYAVIQVKTKGLRIKEQKDDADGDDDDDEVNEHDGNGNNHCHTNGNDGNDHDDKLRDSSDLPEGWQRHEDEQGSYYWHIKSGITQREPPPSPVLQTLPAAKQLNTKTIHSTNGDIKLKAKTKKDIQELPAVSDIKVKPSRPNVPVTGFEDSPQNRFLVRCLGSLPLNEEELSDDRSSQAINQCIASLSHQPGTLQNGSLQGRNFCLEFNGNELLLIDVATGSVVRSEFVKSVRVWGVGKENDSRDFAYVARDPSSDQHLCWVFKCERTGHEVASALRGICLRILKENKNSPQKTSACIRLNENGGSRILHKSHVSKESLKNQFKNWNDQPKKNPNGQSKHWSDLASGVVFPVPMSESKKVINCHYLGMMKVPKPLGMNILNDAIEMIYARVPSSKWVAVSVEVAPSAVTVYDRGFADSVILECRIRFLTFLGIGLNNCRLSAFIMHSAQDEFFAHVFHCSLDAGIFCRTITAACKLRYQKCLDAQTQKDRERGKFSRQTGPLHPFQGLKESLQKGVSNLFRGNGKKQQKG